MTMTDPSPVLQVPAQRAVTYLVWCRAAVWALCLGGFAMGLLVSRAHSLGAAKFTALSELPGWPEIWGATLMLLGGLSLLGRMVGRHGVRVGVVLVDGITVAGTAMLGMSLWYVVFASSLILGTAQYGYAPYLTLAALHGIFAILVVKTQGFRPTQAGRG